MTTKCGPVEFFDLSKLFWFVVAPSHLLVWALAIGVIFQHWLFGRVLLILGALSFLGLLLLPIGDWAMSSIEDQYARGAWPVRVDGVLELGGGINPGVLATRGLPGAETGEGAMVAAAELARHYPGTRIIFSGGDPDRGVSEAGVARFVFRQLGIAQDNIIYEDRARDTWENLVFSRALAKPKPGEIWLLVTSAAHMPRAMAVARRLSWTMRAWPSDYVTVPGGGPESFGVNVAHLDLAAHEWVGLAIYRLVGRAR